MPYWMSSYPSIRIIPPELPLPADFFVTNDTEWNQVFGKPNSELEGKIVEIQGSNFSPTFNRFLSQKNFVATLTIRGQDSNAIIPRIRFYGTCGNITLKNLKFKAQGWPPAPIVVSGTPRAVAEVIYFDTGTYTGITFDGCDFSHGYGVNGGPLDTTATYPEYEKVDNVGTATTTSSRIALSYPAVSTDSIGGRFWVFNRGASNIYVKFGDSSVVATTADLRVSPGSYVGSAGGNANKFTSPRATHVAAISASGSVEYNARAEVGLGQFLTNAFGAAGNSTVKDFTIKNCHFYDLSNAVKSISSSKGAASTLIIMDNTFDRIYQDIIAVSHNASSGWAYVLRNTYTMPFSQSGVPEDSSPPGDAGDPHGDIFQLFNPGRTEVVQNVISAGNWPKYQATRGDSGSQGNFWSDADGSPVGFRHTYSIADLMIGSMARQQQMGSNPVDGGYVYGGTHISVNDGVASIGSTYLTTYTGTHSFVDKTFTDGINNSGTGTVEQGTNYLLTASTITDVFPNWSTWTSATSRETVKNTFTTAGSASGIGAVAAYSMLNWTTTDPTQVVKWDLLPSGVEWANQTGLTTNTLTTLPLKKVLNIKSGQTVVPGSGVEWRSYDTNGTSLLQDWTTNSGTIEPYQYIQFRVTTSASPATTITRTLTINGLPVSVDFTTA